MADRTGFYRGYELAYYTRNRGGKVRILIWEKDGLPPIHAGPDGNSMAEAEKAAKAAIDEKLARASEPDSN
jgi:hypothetical protein